MNFIKKILPFIIIIFLSFWAIAPLFKTGYFPMHDDTQPSRVFEMHKALSDGNFPVRWVPDLGYGYGYPIFNFYAPFAYYVGASFMFLGFDALIATKIMTGFATILAGVFMYFISREFWGKLGGIISSLLYLYAPYHGLNIYVRGALSELWAYAFVPLVFLGIYKIFAILKVYISSKSLKQKEKNKIDKSLWNWVCISSLSYTAVILSHNLTAMMITPFIFTFAVFLYITTRMREKIYKPHFILLGILLGIVLSAFYWLPAVLEMQFTNVLSVVGGGSDYRDHFACISQLWNSPWGYGGSVPGCVDGLSLKIGKLHLVLGAVSLVSLIFLQKINRTKFNIVFLFLIYLLISSFLIIKESKYIWDLIPQMAFFQFPWRFLLLTSFFISFLGGGIFWVVENQTNDKKWGKYFIWIIFFVTAIAIIYLNQEAFLPQRITDIKSSDYTNKKSLNFDISLISDEYMSKGFYRPRTPAEVPGGRVAPNKDISVFNLTEKTQTISFTAETKKKNNLNVNLAYFPTWHVYIDGKQQWFKYFNKGLILEIPEGRHSVEILYRQTPYEAWGNAISVTGVIILIAGIIRPRKMLNNA